MQLHFRLFKMCVLVALVIPMDVFSVERIDVAVSKLARATLGAMIDADRGGSNRLRLKDYSNIGSLDFLGDTNYCTSAIVDLIGDITYVTYDRIDSSLKKVAHSRRYNMDGSDVAVFCSGGKDKALEDFLKTEFESYHLRVFKSPFPNLYPIGEVHFRKSDSEQKLLHTMSSFYEKGWNTPLLYTGRVLVLYSIRNTCQFCNVSLVGFISEQISRVAEGLPSLFIKGIHVFYSFDDGKLLKSESDRVKVSPFLVQPYITYTQLTKVQTVKYMIENVLTDTSYNKDLFGQLINGMSPEDLKELWGQLIKEIPLEGTKELFCRLFYGTPLEIINEFCKELQKITPEDANMLFDWLLEKDEKQLNVFLNTPDNVERIISFIKVNHLFLSASSVNYLLDKLSEMYASRTRIDENTSYIKMLLTLPEKPNVSIVNHGQWQERPRKNLLVRLLGKRAGQ